MSYLKKAQEFQQLMKKKGSMEAFEKYYAENVVVTEVPTGVVRNGKQEQREAIQAWFSNLQEIHGAGAKAITSNEETGVTMIESWFDMTFKGGIRRKMEEIAVQQWDGDQIVNEKFYYNTQG